VASIYLVFFIVCYTASDSGIDSGKGAKGGELIFCPYRNSNV